MSTGPQRILILGATSSIAQEFAKLYAAEGARFFLVGRRPERLTAIAQDLKVRGAGDAEAGTVDLADISNHADVLKQAVNWLGGVDIALLAHGTLGNQAEGEDDYLAAEQIIRANFLSHVSLLTWLANYCEKQRGGYLVAITSVAGDRGRKSNYLYGCAKGALGLFLQGIRNRLFQSGVKVLTVKPGFVSTPMTAHLTQGLLFAKPDTVARGIRKAINRNADEVYLPGFWLLIMLIITKIPERIFKRMNL